MGPTAVHPNPSKKISETKNATRKWILNSRNAITQEPRSEREGGEKCRHINLNENQNGAFFASMNSHMWNSTSLLGNEKSNVVI